MDPGEPRYGWDTIMNHLQGARVVVVVLSENFQVLQYHAFHPELVWY